MGPPSADRSHWVDVHDVGQEEKSLLETLEGRWVRKDGQEMAEVVGPNGLLRWSKAGRGCGGSVVQPAVVQTFFAELQHVATQGRHESECMLVMV